MENLLALFTFAGIGFWLFIAAFVILEIIALEYESATYATLVLIFSATILAFLSHTNPLTWSAQHPLMLVGAVLSYFVGGTVWSIAKWYFYVKGKSVQVRTIVAQYLAEARVGTVAELNDMRRGVLTTQIKQTGLTTTAPQVTKHKALILLWMTYWPVSMVWTLINDPVKKVFTAIYIRIGTFMQSISDRIFKDAFN
jgi:hypothetical protein